MANFLISFFPPFRDVQFFTTIGARFQIFTPSLMNVDLSWWELEFDFLIKVCLRRNSTINCESSNVKILSMCIVWIKPTFDPKNSVHNFIMILCVVYFDQLLGAERTQKLVKLLFFSGFQPFLFILKNQLKKEDFEVPPLEVDQLWGVDKIWKKTCFL